MQKRYLTEEEQRQLLAVAKSYADPLAQRDYHWMAALILTGMRIQEFSRLTVPQVRQGLMTGWLVSRKEHCKGRRRANDYLVTAKLRGHLEALVRMSLEQGDGMDLDPTLEQPLIWGRDVTGRAAPLGVRSYELRMKHWAAVAGLDPRMSPHWLRHTRGMNIMRRSRGDNPLKVAQVALNHASLASTGVYLQLSREEYARELQAVDGGRLPKKVARVLAQRVGLHG